MGVETIDFQYCVSYDTEDEYNHDEDDDFCRCRIITDVKIGDIDIQECAKLICKHFDIKNKITKYAVERFAATLKIADFEWKVCNSYYGQEVKNITLDNGTQHKLLNFIKSPDHIRASLLLEYGQLLPKLKDAKFEMKQVPLKQITFSGHMNRINRDRVQFYKLHKIFNCLVQREDDTHYKLIDGRHRFTAAQESNVKKIEVVWFT